MVGFFKRTGDKLLNDRGATRSEITTSLPGSDLATASDTTLTADSSNYGKANSTPYPSTTRHIEPPRRMHNSGTATTSEKKLPVPPTRTTTGNSIEALDRFEAAGAGVTPDFQRRHHKEPHRSAPGHNMNAYDYPAYPSSKVGEGEHIIDPQAREIEQKDKSVRHYDNKRVPDYYDEATDLDPAGKRLDGRPSGHGTKHSAFGLGGPGLGAEMIPDPEAPAWQGGSGRLRNELPVRGGRDERAPSQIYYEGRDESGKYQPMRNQSFEDQKGYPASTTIDHGQDVHGEAKRVILNESGKAQTAQSGDDRGQFFGGMDTREVGSHKHTKTKETIPTWRYYQDSNLAGRETAHSYEHPNPDVSTGYRTGSCDGLRDSTGIYEQKEKQYINDLSYARRDSGYQDRTPDVSSMPGGFRDDTTSQRTETRRPNEELGGRNIAVPTTRQKTQQPQGAHVNFSSQPLGQVDSSKLAHPNPANINPNPVSTGNSGNKPQRSLPRPQDLQQKQFSDRLRQPHTTTSKMAGMGSGYTGTHSSTPTTATHADPTGTRTEKLKSYGHPSSSNEIRQQVPPGATDNYVPMSQRHIVGGRGVMEPSVGADPASGQSVDRGSCVVANPLEDPGEGSTFGSVSLEEQRAGSSNIGPNEGAKERYYDTQNGNRAGMDSGRCTTSGSQPSSTTTTTTKRTDYADSTIRPSSGNNMNTIIGGQKLPESHGTDKGTGEQWVRSTGTLADGGNFDAAAPGAGKEADRLLEEAGVDRKGEGKTARVAAGHKLGLGEKLGFHR